MRGVCHFSTKLVVMATSLEILEKEVQDGYSEPKMLLFGEKIVNIGPVYPEIIVLRAMIKRKKIQKDINASKIYSPVCKCIPSGLNEPTKFVNGRPWIYLSIEYLTLWINLSMS